ncbi:MAG: penicillin-binding protein 2, partial [Muribaculaceae bacterium]|nr:penicillin-binding protein 2 [Muribaculaceae bacterium]
MSKDYNLEKRKYVIAGFICVIVALYIVRLFNLQVSDDKYKLNAESNAFLRRTIYPARGLIYDRNGELVVFNQPAYDVMMIPKDVTSFDTTTFCTTLGITREQLREKFAEMRDPRRNPGYSSYTPQKLLVHLSPEDYGRLQEKLY